VNIIELEFLDKTVIEYLEVKYLSKYIEFENYNLFVGLTLSESGDFQGI